MKREADVVDMRNVRKASALSLKSGECVRVVAGGTSEAYGQKRRVTQRTFYVCGVGGHGKAASLQIMTPGTKDGNRKVLVGDANKMCEFIWPGVHYESDLLPQYRDNIRELHGPGLGRARRSRRRRRR